MHLQSYESPLLFFGGGILTATIILIHASNFRAQFLLASRNVESGAFFIS